MANMESPIIKLTSVSKVYPPDHRALDDVNLEVEKGEFIFLTGPSGSGKTTLLRLLYCADRPTSGDIWIDGVDLASLSRGQIPFLRRKIGVVFQDFKLLTNRTIFDNVAITLEVLGLGRQQIEKMVRDILAVVGLEEREDAFPLELSGGEQQRVAIARAVVNRPPIILADEPTGNLDRLRTDEVIELMEELNARGATILFATHDERLFTNTHRRVIQLKNGKLENGL